MQGTVELLFGLNDLHWQGSVYQWLFYAAILLTLIFEKRKLIRIVFGWVPALLLVCMFNPLCIKLLNIAGLYKEAYFVRLFSFIPLMYVIARGFMFLTFIGKPWLKLACVILICTAICLVGKNIYRESWLTKAENLEKVPEETLEIIEAIKAQGERPVSIAAIGESRVYLRQVDDVIMPYGRQTGELGELLSLKSVDVKRVMEMAGRQDVDYIMVRRTRGVLSSFLKYRYQPFAMTKHYSVYKVEGVPRLRKDLNEKKQVVTATYLDASGIPAEADAGYTSVRYEYDSKGNIIRETYLDRNGELYTAEEGYASKETSYYINGRVKTVSYLDRNENPIVVDGRYETRYRYNWLGQVIREIYYDTDGSTIAETGEGSPAGETCLRFYRRTSGARRNGNDISFDTRREGNRFSAVWFQLFNGVTGEHLFNFGEGYGTGDVSGEYFHQLPSGLYRLIFRGNTNLADEYIMSLEYLTEGETLYYSYHVDEFQDKTIRVSNMYIGREKP